MKEITIYGHSDDLIEVEGDITDEFYVDCEETSYLCVSDGTLIEIVYSDGGMWRLTAMASGHAYAGKDEGKNPDTDYSDKILLAGDVQWVALAKNFAS
jgi:hypothetical protein